MRPGQPSVFAVLVLGLAGLAPARARAQGPLDRLTAREGCQFGYVWREAVQGDYVCVTPGTRSQAWDDNSHAADRVHPVNRDYGPDTCQYGYVWREVVRGDHVCVTPGTRVQTWDDNGHVDERVAR